MLVLTRKQGEKIRIGNNIVLTVVGVSDNQIKIGIDAPADVKILREEIYSKVKEHTVQATKMSNIQLDINKLKLNKVNDRNNDYS